MMEQRNEFEQYQKVKEKISKEIKQAIEKGHTYRVRGDGTSIETMALKIAAALEMGYNVKNVKVKEGYCYAEFHWGEEPTASGITIANSDIPTTVGRYITAGFCSGKDE